MPLNPAQYTERRDTLAQLLNDTVVALQSVSDEAQHIEPGLIQGHINELTAIHKKVHENQFRLVLVARFQGGKSTTFNAVAMGGRVISPMGDGAIKCSASLIAARNGEDPAQRGVTLTWRSNRDLARLCEDVLTSGPIDLVTPTGREAARRAFEDELKQYQSNRDRYPADKIELLPIVDLITRFAGDPALAGLQRRLKDQPPSPTEVAQLVRFPDEFSLRWPDQAGSFTLQESLFVFLQATHLADDAPSLKRLGLEVVDCPGLFASRFDTGVAHAMIATADAVWYLLDGKAAGEADLKAIALCRQLANNALFVSVNLKADINPTRKHITTKIMPHIAGQLTQAGLNVELQPYHALLALLGQTGAGLLAGREFADTTDFMRQLVDDWSLDVDEPNAAGYWSALCEHLLERLKSGIQDYRAAGGQLNPQTLAIVERESGLANILGQLEQFVVKTRAQTILIDRGVNHAISAVEKGVEQPLAALEVSASQNEEIARASYQEADMALARFEAHAADQLGYIKGNQGDLLDKQLAGEFFDSTIMAAIPQIAADAADDIVEQVSFFDNLKGLFFKEKLQAKIKSIVEGHFRNVTQQLVMEWMKQLGPTTSPAVAGMLQQAQRITQTLQHYWQGAVSGHEALANLGDPVLPSAAFEVADLAEVLGSASIYNMAGGVASTTLFLGGSAALVYLVVAFAPVAAVIGVVGGMLLLVINSLNADDDSYRQKTEKTIKDNLDAQLRSKRVEIIAQLLQPTVDSGITLRLVRENMVAALESPIKETRVRFDAQRQSAMSILENKALDRAAIAEDCRRLRQERVIPLRQKLEAYRDETLPMCATQATSLLKSDTAQP